MFRNAKVGDRIWSLRHGWCIVEINNSDCITAQSDNNRIVTCRLDGKACASDINPSFFWDEVKIDPPKHKVPMYKVLYCEAGTPEIAEVSELYYSNRKDFENRNKEYLIFMQLLETTKKDV